MHPPQIAGVPDGPKAHMEAARLGDAQDLPQKMWKADACRHASHRFNCRNLMVETFVVMVVVVMLAQASIV